MRYFKQQGNQMYGEQRYEEACYFYQKAIIYADYTFPEDGAQIAEMELLTQQSNINLAICLIKQQKWDKVEMHLREAARKGEESEKDPLTQHKSAKTRAKAYYWHCKYFIHKACLEKAAQMVDQLQQLDGDSDEVKALRA